MTRNRVEPWGSVTGIGSLPHTDPVAAVAFVAQYSPELPFWPQLPNYAPEEYMLLQMLTPVLDLVTQQSPAHIDVEPGQLTTLCHRLRSAEATFAPRTAVGFYTFERACMDGLFPQARMLKGQISGPLTISRCLFANGRSLFHSLDFMADLTDYLCRLVTWQIERLQRFGKPVMIFVDEPVLALEPVDSPVMPFLRQVIQTIRTAGAMAGIHCCALGSPHSLLAADPDILSFDAHHGLDTFLHDPQMPGFVNAGGWLAFGLVPTLADLDNLAPEDSFARWVGTAIAANYDLDRLAAQSLVTATCGLGLLSVETAQRAFLHSQTLTHKLRQAEEMIHGN